MTQCKEGSSYLHREFCLPACTPALPHTTSDAGNYKKLKVSNISCAPSDLAALVCLALWHVYLKWYSADRVTESMNKQKFLLMVHPCGRPSKSVSAYMGFCYVLISSCILRDSVGFAQVFNCTALACLEILLPHAENQQSNSAFAVILGVPLFTAPAFVEVVDYLCSSSQGQDPLHSTLAIEGLFHWRAEALTALCRLCIRFHIINFTWCIVGGSNMLQFFDCCYKFLQSVTFTWLWMVF